MSLEAELQEYKTLLKAIKLIHPHLSSPLERPLTIPAVFRKSDSENFISDYLAYILDPERNGIGLAPLQGLINAVNGLVDLSDSRTVKIFREYSFGDGNGRIDLLILIDGNYLVGIENKILSSEGEGQTSRYVGAIEKEFSDYERYYIFLTPDGEKAEADEFNSVSYKQLLGILKGIRYDWAKDIRKSVIWQDFLLHLEFYIVMERNSLQLSEKGKLYVEHQEIIEDIRRAYEQDAGRIFDYVLFRIKQEMGTEWIFDFKDSRGYQQIWKETWKSGGLWVHYEFGYQLNFLTGTSFRFAVDVEGKKSARDEFGKLFKEKYDRGLKNEYERKGITYRPSDWKVAIARKEYPFETDVARIEEPFITAIDEFSFLTQVIDEIVHKLGGV